MQTIKELYDSLLRKRNRLENEIRSLKEFINENFDNDEMLLTDSISELDNLELELFDLNEDISVIEYSDNSPID